MNAFAVRSDPAVPAQHLLKPLEMCGRENGSYEYRCVLFDPRTLFAAEESVRAPSSEVRVFSPERLNGSFYRVLGQTDLGDDSAWIAPMLMDSLLLRST